MKTDRSDPGATDGYGLPRTDRDAGRATADAGTRIAIPDGAERDTRFSSADAEPTREDVERLEAALARSERRLQRVVARYERLLDERDRRLAEGDGASTSRSRLAAVWAAVARFVSRRR